MPELPEVETVRTGLESALVGTTIRKVTLRRKNLRIPFPDDFSATLEGKAIVAIKRRAKYLLFYLGKNDVLIAHLGMSGRFAIPALVEGSDARPGLHDHVIIELTDGRSLIYNDPRRFGLMTLVKQSKLNSHPLLSDLGPEPFEKEFSPAYLKQALASRSSPIKTTIMDQKLVVGVGNIYASEALFLAGINPNKSAKTASSKSAELVAAIRKVLGDAIASGGSSLKDFVQVSGEAGYFQHHFNVYGRAGKPCFTCRTPVGNVRMAGRSTFFCPVCQK